MWLGIQLTWSSARDVSPSVNVAGAACRHSGRGWGTEVDKMSLCLFGSQGYERGLHHKGFHIHMDMCEHTYVHASMHKQTCVIHTYCTHNPTEKNKSVILNSELSFKLKPLNLCRQEDILHTLFYFIHSSTPRNQGPL